MSSDSENSFEQNRLSMKKPNLLNEEVRASLIIDSEELSEEAAMGGSHLGSTDYTDSSRESSIVSLFFLLEKMSLTGASNGIFQNFGFFQLVLLACRFKNFRE
jgi:hypothetical protein